MVGRRLRKWLLSGCVAASAVGCNRNEVRSPWDVNGAQPVTGLPTTPPKKPFWGNSQPLLPTDVATETQRKGPPAPETEVAFADVRVEAAFDENQPPTNREALLDLARQGYQKALQQDPKNKAALLGLARYYTRLGDREKAVEVYKRYLAAFPKEREVVHEVALAHARWKDWAGAVTWCESALQLDPENLTFRKTMAFCLARGGKWEDAFKVMCQVMPEAQARYLMARVLEHQNYGEASRQQLMLALKADPNFADAREFLAELDRNLAPGGAGDPNGLKLASFTQQP